ncbi:MAG: DegV family protein [Clostridia bacterium]|nr:DegV family protein [Clostridia bacterium]
MAIQLITDSTCYIPSTLLEHYQIKVVPLTANFEDASFLDLPQDYKAFYEKLKSVDYIPKSSQPTFATMYEAMESSVKNGDAVIGTFLSSKMSGTYGTAAIIKSQLLEDYPEAQVTIIDSMTNSMQLGLCVLAGAEVLEGGGDYDDVIAAIKRAIISTKFIFAPATLTYLNRGGRIGNAAAFIGQLLQVKPILMVVDGMTTTLDKVRTRKRSIQYLADTFLKDIEAYGLRKVVIHHIEDMEEAEKLKNLLFEGVQLESIEIIDIGPVIGTHVGPGAIGIAYEMEEPLRL